MFLAGFGNSASDLLLGGTPHRMQQWIDAWGPSSAWFAVTALAFRQVDAAGT